MASYKILDGAMGSELIKRGLSLPNHIWSADANIKYPEMVQQIHQEYINAGADYITANTFRTTARAYEKVEFGGRDAGDSAREAKTSLNKAVELAKKALDVLEFETALPDELKESFKKGVLEYQGDEKWWELVNERRTPGGGEIDPDDPEVHRILGAIRLVKGEFDSGGNAVNIYIDKDYSNSNNIFLVASKNCINKSIVLQCNEV